MSVEHFTMFRKLCLELHLSTCPVRGRFYDVWFLDATIVINCYLVLCYQLSCYLVVNYFVIKFQRSNVSRLGMNFPPVLWGSWQGL